MALLFRDEANFQYRQYGFARYRQLLSFYAFNWIRVNLLTTVGIMPLAAGVLISVLYSSAALLIPLSLLGGAFFGPFLAGQFDATMRGLRDVPGRWWESWKRSWRQNWRSSLLPGAVTGLAVGLFAFMFYVMWSAEVRPELGTLLMYIAGVFLFILFSTLYWPQLVLFEQKNSIRLKNAVLFMVKHSWKVLGVTLIEMGYLALYVLFAPWTVLLVPFLGLWYIIFLSQYKLYDAMNGDYAIEEQLRPIEGDPWAPDAVVERAYQNSSSEWDDGE